MQLVPYHATLTFLFVVQLAITLCAQNPSYIRFTTDDGLPTNYVCGGVEDIMVIRDSTLLVASNFGLHKVQSKAMTLPDLDENVLQLQQIEANGEIISLEDLDHLSHTTNQLRFSFYLRSYASHGNINYQTRLVPLELEWQQSTTRTKSYRRLRPGQYTFHLRAIDGFGREVAYPATTITIRKAIWQYGWFQILIIVIIVIIAVSVLTIYSIQYRIKKSHLELAKEKALNKRLAEMKMQPLKAQMNPHFIFNALGSIQYFIQTREIELADDYLTRFARLMRLYLDSSREILLPLKQEVTLLKNYIALEQMRFEDQFQIELEVAKDISSSYSTIPSMMIQPFVENAITYGLGERQDGQGCLSIHFKSCVPNTICCIIRDNGVGRKQSAKRSKAGHYSRGMQIIQDKIDTLNATDLVEVSYTITDAEPDHMSFPGTVVTICFKNLQ